MMPHNIQSGDILPMDPHQHKVSRVGFRAAEIVVVIIFLSTILWVLAIVWPYSKVSVEYTSGILSDEYTSEGIPVVRSGHTINYTVDYCNEGVDVNTTRWLDSYGNVDQVTNFSQEEGVFSSSRLLSETFYPINGADGCFEDIHVAVNVGFIIPTGVYYRLRTVSSYKPNFVATVSEETTSDLFYLAESNGNIP